MANQLVRRAPESVGVSAQHIGDFYSRIESEGLGLHSFMLLKEGAVVAEHWWAPYAPDKRHMLFSLSKSFTSTAIGMAVAEGRLMEDQPIVEFFPEYMTSEIAANFNDVHIRHLLSMSTGHIEDTMPHLHQAEDGDWVRAFFSVPIHKTPGTHFLYNTGATYMLSAILQRVTGEKLIDYLQPRLFEPLGIEDPTWETCPKGVNTGGFGLSIKTEDIAKFGQLYLQEGSWNGRQVVPQDWVKAATSTQVANPNESNVDWRQGYGYQFWRCRHQAYRGDGAFGQYCVVIPEKSTVVAITSGLNDMQAVLNALWDTILPGLDGTDATSGGSIPSDYHPSESLRFPAEVGHSVAAVPSWVRRALRLEGNGFDWTSFTLDVKSEGFTVTLVSDHENRALAGRYDAWVESVANLRGIGDEPIAIQGGWRNPSTFCFSVCFTETPFVWTIEAIGDAASGTLVVTPNVGFGSHPSTLTGTWV